MTTTSPTPPVLGRRAALHASATPLVATGLVVLLGLLRARTGLGDGLPSGAYLICAACGVSAVVLLLADRSATVGGVRGFGTTGAVLVGISVAHLHAVADEPAAIPLAGGTGLLLGLVLCFMATEAATGQPSTPRR